MHIWRVAYIFLLRDIRKNCFSRGRSQAVSSKRTQLSPRSPITDQGSHDNGPLFKHLESPHAALGSVCSSIRSLPAPPAQRLAHVVRAKTAAGVECKRSRTLHPVRSCPLRRCFIDAQNVSTVDRLQITSRPHDRSRTRPPDFVWPLFVNTPTSVRCSSWSGRRGHSPSGWGTSRCRTRS